MRLICYYVRNDVRSARDGRFSRRDMGDRLGRSGAFCICPMVGVDPSHDSSCRPPERTASALGPE
jgi:hypothetical protein